MAGISNPAVSANSVVNTPISTGGAGEGGYLVNKKDEKAPETAAQFGEVLKSIQSKYGAKPDKAREIKKTLGKDDFLKIMITQMKNQDPTKPFNADEMAAQMAQYASVEQLQNVNQNLNKMQTDHQSSDRMAMTSMIGKTITVDRERFPHTEGVNESLGYTLTKNASEVKLSVINEAGETVFEKDIGAQKAGEQTYGWDGVKTNTLPAKTGGYTFKITAKDEHGAALPTNPKTQGKVIGVSFEGSEPTLLIGDAHQQQKVTIWWKSQGRLCLRYRAGKHCKGRRPKLLKPVHKVLEEIFSLSQEEWVHKTLIPLHFLRKLSRRWLNIRRRGPPLKVARRLTRPVARPQTVVPLQVA
jgi:flagellar basal-body rod modification protein FlgD